MNASTLAWTSASISFAAMLVSIVFALLNIRLARRAQTLPYRIKYTQDQIRGIPFGDLALTQSRLQMVYDVLDLNNLEHVKKMMIPSARKQAENQNVPASYFHPTQEERLVDLLLKLECLLGEQAGQKAT